MSKELECVQKGARCAVVLAGLGYSAGLLVIAWKSLKIASK